MTKKFAFLTLFLLLPFVALAEDVRDPAEAKDLFAEVNKKMHHEMMVEPTGDVDVDFVRGMIPHHQGAVEMAQIEMQLGKDPEIRKLAQDIIDAQKQEIALMQKWLQKHAPKHAHAPDAIKHHSHH